MIAIFNRNCELIGWSDMKYVFDENMNWIAFIYGGNCFNARDCGWIGPVLDTNFLDTEGKVIGWSKESPIRGLPYFPLRPLRPLKPLAPLRPLRPLTPLRPLRPLSPIRGWSNKERITI